MLKNNSKFHFFHQHIATKIGQDESILINQIIYWQSKCGRDIAGYQGKWIYNSLRQWHSEHFSYWSMYRLRKTIKSLEDKNLIKSAKVNSKKWNHTKWYSVDEENYNKLTIATETDISDQETYSTKKTIINSVLQESSFNLYPTKQEKNQETQTTNRFVENQQIISIQNNNYTNKYSSYNTEDSNNDINNEILEEYNGSFDNKPNNLGLIKVKPIDLSVELSKEEQTIAKEMIDTWNKEFKETNNAIKAYSNKQIIKKLYNLHQNVFMSNFDGWKDYILKVTSSKFLMGEKETNNSFKAVFPWLIKEEVVKNIFNGAYGIGDRDHNYINSTNEAEESNRIDDDSIVDENIIITSSMLDIWNKTLNEDTSKIKLNLRRSKNLYEAYNFLSQDISKWQEYCNKIASSKFLMGEATSFKASIDWCIKCEVIENILAGKYKCGDRSYKKNYVPIKLDLLSRDPLWIKVIDKFKIHHGEAKTISWLSKLDFKLIDQNTVSLSCRSKFILSYVETHYLNQLRSIFKEINMNINNVVLNNIINTKNICCSESDGDQDYLIRLAC
jgi:hypothetical protein